MPVGVNFLFGQLHLGCVCVRVLASALKALRLPGNNAC